MLKLLQHFNKNNKYLLQLLYFLPHSIIITLKLHRIKFLYIFQLEINLKHYILIFTVLKFQLG